MWLDLKKYSFMTSCLLSFVACKKSSANTTNPDGISVLNVQCLDRNLQRTLTWEPMYNSDQYILKGYKVKYCEMSKCEWRNPKCYSDIRRREVVGNITQPRCSLGADKILSYNILAFKVRAVYQKLGSDITKESVWKNISCAPIQSRMSLDPPSLKFKQKSKAITVRSILPKELKDAMKKTNYKLDIKYFFCLHKAGEECKVKEEKRKPSHTFLNLESSTNYHVSSWYMSRIAGRDIKSAVYNTTVATLKDGVWNIKCQDRNLQRTLTWEPKSHSHQYILMGYKVQYCVMSSCTWRKPKCYTDINRTKEVGNITEPRCILGVDQLLPYNFLAFKVRALYQKKGSNIIERSVWEEKTCDPIQSSMSLDPPSLELVKQKINAITVRSILPKELTEAMTKASYELDIRYYFCLHEDGEKCEVKEEKCNPFYTFLTLKSSTKYYVSSWYTSRTGKNIKSAMYNTTVTTLKDPFPVKYQIMMVVGLSSLVVIIVITVVIVKVVRKMWKNWYQYIHEELPKYIEETKEEFKSWRPGDGGIRDLRPGKKENELVLPQISLCENLQHPTDETNGPWVVSTNSNSYCEGMAIQSVESSEISDKATTTLLYNRDKFTPPSYVKKSLYTE